MASTSVEIEGDQTLSLFIHHLDGYSRRFLKDLLDDVGLFSQRVARVAAPVGETGQLVRRIKRTGVQYAPGGSGGGGWYQQIVHVEGLDADPYPYFVHQGTKKYFVRRRSFTNPNRPGVMKIQKLGEPTVFTQHRKGQKANPFLRTAYNSALIYAKGKMTTFGRDLNY